jgi:hypothetical protein
MDLDVAAKGARMQGCVRKLTALACALGAVLVASTTAAAANGPLPWEGGLEVLSDFEARSSTAVTELARRQVWTLCASPDEWAQVATAQAFNADEVWGITPFDEAGKPLDFALISPQACLAASEWVYAADRRTQKWCVTGSKTEYRTESVRKVRTRYRTVVRRKKVAGAWKRVRVRVAEKVPYTESRQVPYQVPVESVCEDYVVPKLFAWQTLIHEGVHLAGESNEAATECYALQLLPWFASQLGIDAAQAREIGVDYWSFFYQVYRPGDPDYFSPECRDDGVLDLRPDSHDWPLLRRASVPVADVATLFTAPVPLVATRH